MDSGAKILNAASGFLVLVVCALLPIALGFAGSFTESAAAVALGSTVAALLLARAGYARIEDAVNGLAEETRKLAKEGRRDEVLPRADDGVGRLGRAVDELTARLELSVEERSRERDRLTYILDGMGEGVLLIAEDGEVQLANRAARSMAAAGEDGEKRALIVWFRSASLEDAFQRTLADGQPLTREIELGGVLPRRVLVRVTRLGTRERGASSEATGGRPSVLVVLHDVTDVRRLETIRTDFVANVSHELRTPISAISASAETLLAGALASPEDATEFVTMIERQALRLRQLVDDLLDLSKLEAKGFKLELTPIDARLVAEHVARLATPAAERRESKLVVRAAAQPAIARVDRRALEQVASNLVDNAIKYAGNGATIVLEVTLLPEHVELSVADDGPGIAPAHVGRIFERFYRVDAGRSRELGGTGLGLAIVKHLVELLQGTIDVTSQVGKGTKFSVRLPRASAESIEPSTEPTPD